MSVLITRTGFAALTLSLHHASPEFWLDGWQPEACPPNDIIARFINEVAHPVKIDANQFAMPFHRLARHKDGINVAGIHPPDNRANRVIHH